MKEKGKTSHLTEYFKDKELNRRAHMSIYSDSNILTAEDVKFLLDLLPLPQYVSPTIYIFNDWKSALSLTNNKFTLDQQYYLLKSIVHRGVFSTYNYKYNMIFIYLFNLPYHDPISIKLHGAFCLFHEIRHNQQYNSSKTAFLSDLTRPSAYSHLWVEKDANNYALKWLRRNLRIINERFDLHHVAWDFKVSPNNRLRIYTNHVDIRQKNDILV
jgi:hypothetical protein